MTRETAICGLEDMLMSKIDGRNNLEVYGEEIPIMLVQDIEALKLAIEALELTSVKECSTCLDKGCCAIFDNFNINYCSDYRGKKND